MELSSPAANMDEDLSNMMDEILDSSDLDGESSDTSYGSSNSSEEENLQPSELKKYYEDVLDINASTSTSRPVLRSVPSDYSSSCTESPTPKRKRQRNPSLWKQNIRKNLRERGKSKVKAHIRSFPTIDSHYCRSSTSRKYLESHLNVQKMYNLYREKCMEPKDQCDRCVWYKNNEKACSEEKRQEYYKHIEEKKFCKAEREKDRQNIDESLAILCYDLENVITLPKCFASNFY